jgi:four helix bundle protein
MGRGHEDLLAWQLAIDLVDAIYDLTALFPSSEKYGLVSQMQRAAVSVPANIAEGCGRDKTPDLLRHLSIAQGSLAELNTHLEIVRRRNWIDETRLLAVVDEAKRVGRVLVGLQRSLRKKLNSA